MIQNSEDTRKLYERITEYLSELFASGGLTEEQANQTAGIMYILSDVDRMSALCREVCLSLKDKEEKKYKYSKDAMRDMRHSLQLIQEMFTKAVQMMATGNTEAAKDILQQKEKILDLGIKMRKSHVERVGEGKCKAKLTEPYNRIIHHIDRMGNLLYQHRRCRAGQSRSDLSGDRSIKERKTGEKVKRNKKIFCE